MNFLKVFPIFRYFLVHFILKHFTFFSNWGPSQFQSRLEKRLKMKMFKFFLVKLWFFSIDLYLNFLFSIQKLKQAFKNKKPEQIYKMKEFLHFLRDFRFWLRSAVLWDAYPIKSNLTKYKWEESCSEKI